MANIDTARRDALAATGLYIERVAAVMAAESPALEAATVQLFDTDIPDNMKKAILAECEAQLAKLGEQKD